MTEEELFHAALEKPEEARRAFLDEACSGNAALRASVEALLAAHASAGSFLNTAALDANPNQADLAATVDSHIGADATPSDNAGRAAASGHRSRTRDDRGSNDSQNQSTTTILPGEIGATLDGRYTLLEKIGEGGMGEVWVAKQTEPVKRKVALKLIKRGMDSLAVLQRFEQERQALALMDHPNIARVLDGGVTPTGQPYFAMELVNGLPLTKFCDEMKLTLNDRLELFVPICQAVQHAHQKGIVHRDLKPANILVTMIDGRPVPKVIDFGVAKATAGKLTAETMSTGFGSVVGTLEYMSPEQAAFSGEDIDTRADIYSLGVILYELLTGLRPIDANRLRKAALTEMMRIIREEEPSKPSTRLSTNESLPSLAAIRQIEPKKLTALLRGELDWVVMKCLEKQRDRRYETANALARDVQRYLADEAVEARPPSAAYRLQKFVTRNKASVVAVSAVAASLLVGLVGFAWQAHVASEQRDLAIEAEKSESTQRVLAEKARDAEAEALKVSERALFESRHNAARLAYEQAQAHCEEGEADVGLLEMARCLEMTPEGDAELDRAIRTSMNLWAGQMNLVQRRWEPRENKMLNLRSIAFSPDGSSVLLVDMVLGAEIVESQTGKLKCALPFGAPEPANESYYNQGIYSPDGRYVSVLCRDHPFARIWDAATGVLVGKPIEHEAPITGICFDPSSKILVTCEGTTIHFWNISDGTRVWDPIVLEDSLYGVDISSDGKWLLAWPYGPPKVYVLNYPTREFAYTLEGIDFNVSHASFSPDNRWIFTSGFQESDESVPPFAAQFWNVETGEPVGRRIRADSEPASGDAFSHRASFRSDSQVVVTGGEPTRMWHVPSGSPLGAVASSQLGRRPVFLPNSQQLATAEYSDFRLMGVAPFLTPHRTANIFEENDQRLRIFRRDALNIAPDGRTAIVTMEDQKQVFFPLFDLQSGTSIGDQDSAQGYAPKDGWVPPPSFSSDGKSLASAIEENACQILDTATGKERISRVRMDSRITAVVFSPDRKLLATGDIEGNVRVWNASTGEPIGPPMIQQSAVNRVCFSPDGKSLLVAGGLIQQIKGEARLWDVATGQPLGPALDLLGGVTSVAFSPDGKAFATAAWQVALWESASSRNIWTSSTVGWTDRLQFSQDGERILARHREQNSIRVYEARTGVPRTSQIIHQTDVLSTDMSPDGRLMLTSASGRKIRLWDTSLGLPVGPEWSGCNGGLAAFSPDGESIFFIDELNRLMRRDIPKPLEGTPERIRLAIEAGTRISLDSFGAKTGLVPQWQFDPITRKFKVSPDPFDPVDKRLKELGGPTGNLKR